MVRKYGALAAAGISVAAAVALLPGSANADPDGAFGGGQPTANPRVGVQDNRLGGGLDQTPVAWGQLPLVDADTAGGVTHYGYNTAMGDKRTSAGGPLTQDPNEAYKTEPDKNVYLVFGAHRYLYQGHEGGPGGYVTRIDLDQSDPTKKVALVADKDATGKALPTFDGITWDPFSHQLLLTAESKAPTGGVFAVDLDGNGNAKTGVINRLPLGSGGYEGVQNDSDGNVWLVEDVGGAAAGTGNFGKVPNSYVYRFTPADRTDLTKGGTLQALQVKRSNGSPALASQLQADPGDPFLSGLHTYGTTLATAWVTVTDPNSTAGAAAAKATPFKRPENGVFRPGTGFREFYFTETGDTDNRSDLPGAYGAVFRLTQSGPSANSGSISPVTLGDQAHTGFDNISFATADQLLVVEDAGDTLHRQRDALDSGYLIDLRNARKAQTPTRWLAEGRDASATYDALFTPGYNDGDNEITGIHTSDGDPTVGGILGAKLPTPFGRGWRVFWTQQHGDNVTWEIVPEGNVDGHPGDHGDH